MVSMDVDLGVRMEVFDWFLLVLVPFDMENIDGHGKVGDDGADSL